MGRGFPGDGFTVPRLPPPRPLTQTVPHGRPKPQRVHDKTEGGNQNRNRTDLDGSPGRPPPGQPARPDAVPSGAGLRAPGPARSGPPHVLADGPPVEVSGRGRACRRSRTARRTRWSRWRPPPTFGRQDLGEVAARTRPPLRRPSVQLASRRGAPRPETCCRLARSFPAAQDFDVAAPVEAAPASRSPSGRGRPQRETGRQAKARRPADARPPSPR